MATSKKAKAPAKSPDEIESERVAREAKSSNFAHAAEPTWINPKEPLPADAMTSPTRRTIIDEALSIFPDIKTMDTSLLPAVLIAQALDRLGRKVIEAAAISRRIG
jgi:hypothetical protein